MEDTKVTTQQFSMGDELPPVTAKVVEKVLSGQFVNMTVESMSALPTPKTAQPTRA